MNFERREKIILSSSIILMFSYFFIGRLTLQGSKEIFTFSLIKPLFGMTPWIEVYQYVYQFFTAFLFFFIFPLMIIRYVLGEEFSRFGLQIGDFRFGKRIFMLGLVIVIPVMYFLTSMPSIQAEYPLSKMISENLMVLVLYEALYFFYYLSWEFFFRGYLQLGLVRKETTNLDLLVIVSYQTFFSTLLHVGKPISEIIGAAGIGPIFGLIAYKSKSAIYLIGIHYLIGVTTDIYSLIQLGLL